MNDNRFQQIWLEVTNVRIEENAEGKRVNVQLKGDKADQEPVWWPVTVDPKGEKAEEKAEGIYRNISEGLDKKRMVLASLQPTGLRGESPPAGESLEVKYVRVQLTDSSAR